MLKITCYKVLQIKNRYFFIAHIFIWVKGQFDFSKSIHFIKCTMHRKGQKKMKEQKNITVEDCDFNCLYEYFVEKARKKFNLAYDY